MVRPERFELPAFWFVARRSIQLSYGRIVFSTTCESPRFDLPPCCGNYYNENSGPRRRHCSSFAALSANFCMAFGHGIIGRMEKWANSGGCDFRRNLFARRCEYAGPIEDFHV